jgi:hypothetical protein
MHVLEKTHTPNFWSHELDTKITASNTSTTNGAFQSQPYYGMPMNSYPGQMMSPSSLHCRSALGMAGQSTHDHGPSGPPTNHPTPYVGQSEVTPSLPQVSQVKPCTTEWSGYYTKPSRPFADRPITKVRPSRCSHIG